jgi:hypothetical protein
MNLSSLFQFIIGFFLGVFLLAGGTAGLAYVFFSRMAGSPPKPIFSEEKLQQPSATETVKSPAPSTVSTTAAEAPKGEKAPEEPPSEKPVTEKEDLPSGAYKARVTWSTGLSLREEPRVESNRLGGVDYNTEIIVLKQSDDGGWQKIRMTGNGQEGWIKAGNIEKIGVER